LKYKEQKEKKNHSDSGHSTRKNKKIIIFLWMLHEESKAASLVSKISGQLASGMSTRYNISTAS